MATAHHLTRSLEIQGATGINSAAVNGTWDPTGELSCGKPVYVKRGDGGNCIHFWSSTNDWIVSSTENKGKNGAGYAWLEHSGRLETSSRNWRIYDGTERVKQRDVLVQVTNSFVTVTFEGMRIETEYGNKSVLFETCEDADFCSMVRCKQGGWWMTRVCMFHMRSPGGGGLNVRSLIYGTGSSRH